MTIYVVSGFKRTGSSLMMHILKNIGIEPIYNKSYGEGVIKNNGNPYLYEHPSYRHRGFNITELEKLNNKAVKICSSSLINIPSNIDVKIIYMTRRFGAIKQSLKRYKNDDDYKRDMRLYDSIDLGRITKKFNNNDIFFLSYDDLIEETSLTLMQISTFLNKDFDVKHIAKLIEPDRRRAK